VRGRDNEVFKKAHFVDKAGMIPKLSK